MAATPTSTHRGTGAARTGVVGTIVAAVAFFDGVFIGAPIALLAASFRPSLVYVVATVVVVFVVIGCCRWVDRRWDDWFSGNGTRIEKRLETMRASRLMAHPVAWIQRGSDRWYALASTLANPILVATLPRLVDGKPIGERRLWLGAVAYALRYVAMRLHRRLRIGATIRRPSRRTQPGRENGAPARLQCLRVDGCPIDVDPVVVDQLSLRGARR